MPTAPLKKGRSVTAILSLTIDSEVEAVLRRFRLSLR